VESFPPRDTGGVPVITVQLQSRAYGLIKKGELLASSWNSSLLAELMYEMTVTVPNRTGTVLGRKFSLVTRKLLFNHYGVVWF
jgi:hypothetical protein